jgi:peroxiredoxin Q/BCP
LSGIKKTGLLLFFIPFYSPGKNSTFVVLNLSDGMTTIKEGEKAPEFKGTDQNGHPISLNDFKGKNIVLYFYPHDGTPGCTAQACNLRDNYSLLMEKGFQIIGISTDTVKTHKNFESKYQLPFPLIADEDNSISVKYGVWGLKKFMGKEYTGTHRTTFLIDGNGRIRCIILKPNTKRHAEEVLEKWSIITDK